MNLYRPASKEDFAIIHKLQDVPFRDTVYANFLPEYETFEQQTIQNIESGVETYYMFEKDGEVDGFGQYLKGEGDAWNIIVWGKWINTLIYVSLKTGYDDLGITLVTSGVRQDNKRVIRAYEKFRIRRTGQEMMAYRRGGPFGYLGLASFNYYEMTKEEFEERREFLRSQSLEVTVAPPLH